MSDIQTILGLHKWVHDEADRRGLLRSNGSFGAIRWETQLFRAIDHDADKLARLTKRLEMAEKVVQEARIVRSLCLKVGSFEPNPEGEIPLFIAIDRYDAKETP